MVEVDGSADRVAVIGTGAIGSAVVRRLRQHHTVLRQILGLRAGRPLGDGGLPEVAARIDALIAGRHGERLTATIG